MMRGETKKKKENKDKINCVELRGVGVLMHKVVVVVVEEVGCVCSMKRRKYI